MGVCLTGTIPWVLTSTFMGTLPIPHEYSMKNHICLSVISYLFISYNLLNHVTILANQTEKGGRGKTDDPRRNASRSSPNRFALEP